MTDPSTDRRSVLGHRATLILSLGLILCAACGEDGPAAPSFDTLEITTTSLPDGVQGMPYDAMLEANGGDGSFRWAVVGAMTLGSPPAGLAVATSGAITGTPSFIESQGFTVEVRSGDGQTDQRALSITITP